MSQCHIYSNVKIQKIFKKKRCRSQLKTFSPNISEKKTFSLVEAVSCSNTCTYLNPHTRLTFSDTNRMHSHSSCAKTCFSHFF